MGAAMHFAAVTYTDGLGRWVAELGDWNVRGEPGDDQEAVVCRLNGAIRWAADEAGWRLTTMPQWRYRHGMTAREGRVVNFPDLLCPATTGHIASMLRQAVPRYVCLPVFDDGTFRTFVVRSQLGEDGDLLSRHPIEGIALAMALLDVWQRTSMLRQDGPVATGTDFDPRVEMT